LAALRESALRSSAGLTERELQELQEAIRAHEQELKAMEGQQVELAEATPNAPEVLLPDLERRQGELEPREDKALEDARVVIEAAKDRPLRPGEAREGPAAAAMARRENPPEQTEPRGEEGKEGADAAAEREHPQAQGAVARRAALAARQHERIEQLDTARGALGREDQALEKVLRRFHPNQPGRPLGAVELDQLMRAAEIRLALEMARRNRQHAQGRQNLSRGTPAAFTDLPDRLPTTDKMVAPLDADLPELDLATRTLILKLQPQVREELLQGLREQGPEGYRAFIRNYFKRLAETKGSP
jgi:hypothetical protein